MITANDIENALYDVKDPEIPALSVVDLGMITDIAMLGDTSAKITMTPTFAGCPALDHIKNAIQERVLLIDGIEEAEVVVSFETPWNSDRISEKGLEQLKKSGFAPPPRLDGTFFELSVLQDVACPYCNSRNTTLENPFGPTLCRSVHYCRDCRQAFQQFKPVE